MAWNAICGTLHYSLKYSNSLTRIYIKTAEQCKNKKAVFHVPWLVIKEMSIVLGMIGEPGQIKQRKNVENIVFQEN